MYTSDDLDHLLFSATKALVEDVANAALCSIRILEGDKLVSMSHYSSDESPDRPEMEGSIPIGDGKFIRTVGGDAVLMKEIQEVSDLSKDPRFSNQKIVSAGFTSMIAVPVLFNGTALGVAQIYSKDVGYRFSKKEKNVISTLVNNLAHVLVIKKQAEEIEHQRDAAIRTERDRLIGEHVLVITHHMKNLGDAMLGGFAVRILKTLALDPPKADDKDGTANFLRSFRKCAGSNGDLASLLKDPSKLSNEDLVGIARYTLIMLDSSETLTDNLRAILNFGGGIPNKQPTNIGDLVGEVVELFSKSNDDITIDCRIDNNDVIMIDIAQIKRVILELLQNAKEASGIGNTTLSCHVFKCTDDGCAGVRVEVVNKGEIPPDVIKKIFDPFFTTKEHGSGLGLADARKIVEDKHGGEITVRSRLGETSVRICLK